MILKIKKINQYMKQIKLSLSIEEVNILYKIATKER